MLPAITNCVAAPSGPFVAEVVFTDTKITDSTVLAAGLNCALHCTSQSPAASGEAVEVAFNVVPLVAEVVAVELEAYSPMLPACALSFVAVPLMPTVLDGVIRPDAEIVVNAPVFAAVLPIAGGDAKKFVKPAPDSAPVAPNVVNDPALPLIGELVIAVPDIVPLAIAGVEIVGVFSVGLVPKTSAPLPVSSETTPANCAEVVAANCASVPVVNAPFTTHVNPVLLVYWSTLFAVLQLGIGKAVGDALDPVTFATTVLAPCAERFESATEAEGSVTVPVAVRLVNAPVDATCDPIGPGAANIWPPKVDALMLVLQTKPAPFA